MVRTRVGYSGGFGESPTYYNLGGHSESFQVDYDPQRISYAELLELFWLSHNPFNPAWSTQYKAIVFCHDERQRQLAEEARRRLEEESGRTVHTEIRSFERFTRAEDYHQKYLLRRSGLMPEVVGFFASEREFTDSTLSARLNGYLGGHGYRRTLEGEMDSYGLSAAARAQLSEYAGRLDEGEGWAPACAAP